jgi:hypothetical protein
VDDGLPQGVPHCFGQDSTVLIRRTSGRSRYDHGDRTRRIGLRAAGHRIGFDAPGAHHAAHQAELEWRKQKRELDEKAKNLDLEAARKIDEERQKIQDETARRFAEEYRMRDAEKDKKLQDALKVNDELKRKLEQGSQQTQGEVLELQLEELIRAAFPLDQIDAVRKGMNGADVVQKVFNKSGQFCGTIVIS